VPRLNVSANLFISSTVLDTVIGQVEASDSLLEMLAMSHSPDCRQEFVELLAQMFAAQYGDQPTMNSRQFWSAVLDRIRDQHEVFPKSFATLKDRGKARIQYRKRKQELVRSMGLDWDSSRRDQFLSAVPTLYLPQLKTPWPPKDRWVSESNTTGPLWRAHFQEVKLHDDRSKGARKDLIITTDESWAKIVRADESIIVFDSKTEQIVLVVLRNFCGSQKVLDWLSTTIDDAVSIKKSIRLDDPGKIVLNGYTPGNRGAVSLMWAKNLLRTPTRLFESPEGLVNFDFQVSSTYALLWNMMRSKLPPAILADMDKFTKSDGTRAAMDGHGTMGGYYGMELGGDYFEFHSAELAPPQGNYARNYARFTHHEKNAHDYVTIWTTDRREDAAAKGHFYLSSHSIKVESATDTLFAFRGELFHGTTLPDVHPAKLETDFKQISLGFATGRRLVKVLGQVEEGKISEAEMLVRLGELGKNHGESDEIST
jgi:hypothetical protein